MEVIALKSFPNPSEFKTRDEFLYAAEVSSAYKKVALEVLAFVESRVEGAEKFAKDAVQPEVNNFQIGKRGKAKI